MRKQKTLKGAAFLTGFVSALSFITMLPAMQASAAKIIGADFETTNDSFSGRGGASVQWTSDEAYTTNCSLFVSERGETWHGASRDVSDLMKPGQTYKVSCAVLQKSGADVEMKMSMQCKTASGTEYPEIALVTAKDGEWTVLSNDSFTVPADASDMSIYVETSSSLTDFYVDTFAVNGAPAKIKKGDANGDLTVDIADVVALSKYLTTEESEVEIGADMNEDQIINAVDLSLLKNFILFPPEPEIPEGPAVSGDWDNYQEQATGNALKALQGSIRRLGNTYRIREKIAKAQAGEKITST